MEKLIYNEHTSPEETSTELTKILTRITNFPQAVIDKFPRKARDLFNRFNPQEIRKEEDDDKSKRPIYGIRQEFYLDGKEIKVSKNIPLNRDKETRTIEIENFPLNHPLFADMSVSLIINTSAYGTYLEILDLSDGSHGSRIILELETSQNKKEPSYSKYFYIKKSYSYVQERKDKDFLNYLFSLNPTPTLSQEQYQEIQQMLDSVERIFKNGEYRFPNPIISY